MKHGAPLTPAELAEWQKAFDDIDESIKGLEKKENKKEVKK